MCNEHNEENNQNRNCKCIGDILRVIVILQNNAERREEREDPCTKKELRCRREVDCNTRPIQLFLCCGDANEPLAMPTSRGSIDNHTEFSDVFRVEKVDECCATCEVLKKKKKHREDENCMEEEEEEKFEGTDSFFTIDLRFVAIVKCLQDTFVEEV